jgi:DNA-binding transcriptional ArsR family regulator
MKVCCTISCFISLHNDLLKPVSIPAHPWRDQNPIQPRPEPSAWRPDGNLLLKVTPWAGTGRKHHHKAGYHAKEHPCLNNRADFGVVFLHEILISITQSNQPSIIFRVKIFLSELARRLKLRAPTVTHHLTELRLSGLVNLTFVGQEKRYTTRVEALDLMCNALKDFMQTKNEG